MCKAGGVTNFAKLGLLTSHPNYGKSHAPIEGRDDGVVRMSCLYCGRWFDTTVQ